MGEYKLTQVVTYTTACGREEQFQTWFFGFPNEAAGAALCLPCIGRRSCAGDLRLLPLPLPPPRPPMANGAAGGREGGGQPFYKPGLAASRSWREWREIWLTPRHPSPKPRGPLGWRKGEWSQSKCSRLKAKAGAWKRRRNSCPGMSSLRSQPTRPWFLIGKRKALVQHRLKVISTQNFFWPGG